MRWQRALRTPLILLGINLVVGLLTAGVVYGYAGNQVSRRDHLTLTMQNLSSQRASVVEDLAYIEANQTAFDTLLEEGCWRHRTGSRPPGCSSSLAAATTSTASATVSVPSAKRRSAPAGWLG